jgi:hypothetical protein
VLDAFEAALIDALADAVGGAAPAGQPRIAVLPRAGAPVPAGRPVSLSVTLASAAPDPEFGDDSEVALRVSGEWQLRPEIWLNGELTLALAAVSGDPVDSRRNLLRAVDRVLVAMDPATMRRGEALDGEALGFRLTALRLLRLASDDKLADPARLMLHYAWRGRFWPVRPEVAGDPIATPLTRIAVLPLVRPERLTVRAGSGPASLEVRGNLSALGGAEALLLARIAGVAPGTLTGSGAAAPEGFVASAPDAEGRFPLSYAPPDAVDGPVRAVVELRLGAGERTLLLDSLPVDVVPA